VSEVDEDGEVLASFSEVDMSPRHLWSDHEGRVLVADFSKHRVLLLTADGRLRRVVVDTNSQVELLCPTRLYYSDLTSQLYVVHCSEWLPLPDVVSLFSLLRVTKVHTRRRRGAGGTCAPPPKKKIRKIFFGHLSCKIRASC